MAAPAALQAHRLPWAAPGAELPRSLRAAAVGREGQIPGWKDLGVALEQGAALAAQIYDPEHSGPVAAVCRGVCEVSLRTVTQTHPGQALWDVWGGWQPNPGALGLQKVSIG